jgi:CDP-diglyceride synthetase
MDLNHFGKLVYFILPLMLGGIFNMVFMKLPVLSSLKKPIDGGKILWDGERLFGDNKSWKGFLGMILITSLFMGLFGFFFRNFEWAREVSLVDYSRFSFPFNEFFYGGVWGLGYVLAELPNSFVKRRIRIAPGTQISGLKGIIFTIIDQSDSVIGCMIFMLPFFIPTPLEALVIFCIGTGFHYIVNILLYLVGLKNQAG